jgi:hypothetical protein
MANVSLYYSGAEAEYFVDRLPFREGATWNHDGFLTPAEGL